MYKYFTHLSNPVYTVAISWTATGISISIFYSLLFFSLGKFLTVAFCMYNFTFCVEELPPPHQNAKSMGDTH